MRTWLFQSSKQKKNFGDRARWSVGWYDLDGKRRERCIGTRGQAKKAAAKIQAQMIEGTYNGNARKQWEEFRDEFEAEVASGMTPQNRRCTANALDHFQRIVKPKYVVAIRTQTIDRYIAQRRTEYGHKKGSKVSPATVNKELRHIKAVLRKAHKWDYLPKMPDFQMVREPEKLPTYVTPEHFADMYGACDVATMPKGLPYPAGDWWKALLTFLYMTGWRIREPLALRRDDLDLDAGTAVTRAEDNKGKRDELVDLHSVVIDHLRKIVSFHSVVFYWPHNERTLWSEFTRIQEAAGIHLPCHENHEHTNACYLYGFHDLRRAFATMNAETLSGDALQALMRHKSYQTTKGYINMIRQLRRAVDKLHVPDVLKRDAG